MGTSKINVCEIFRAHLKTLRYPNNTISKRDKRIFIYLPIVVSIILVALFSKPTSEAINIFSICLSIFIGLFLNLLILIFSISQSKLTFLDNKNRLELLKQIFNNLSYTIVVSLISLGFLFLITVVKNPSESVSNSLFIWKVSFSTYNVLGLLFSALFYFVFLQVIFTLLMILKRIFKLFSEEFNAMSSESNKEVIENYN